MVPQPKTPILNCFYHLLWLYFLIDSEFSYLAMLAKPYPISSLTPIPLIPNLLHCIRKNAHEVLGTILGTPVTSVLIHKIIYFVYKSLELCI